MALKIIIADDDRLNCMLLSKLMQKYGAECTLTNDGRQAFDMVTQEHFDAALLDVNMPGMTGPECAEKIIEYSAEKKIRKPLTVCISADDMYIDSPLFDYTLPKPFMAEDILAFIKAADICNEEIEYDFGDVSEKIGLDKETMSMLMDEFFSVMDEELGNLKKSIDENSPEMITHVAHKMKGAAAGMMVLKLQELCAQMQNANKSEINAIKLLFIKISCVYIKFKALFTS
jgi:two-component system sensor histidine kinase EvgS